MSGTVDLTPFNAILARLESVATKLEGASGAAAPSAASSGAGDSALVGSFDAYMQKALPPLEAAAKSSGVDDLIGATETVKKSFSMLKDGIAGSTVAAKPKDQDWANILLPVSKVSSEAGKACDNRSDYFQSRKAAAETVNIVAMLAQAAPGRHVQDVFETVDFNITKVLQRKNADEMAWAKTLKEVLKGLVAWCNDECKMGLIWKFQGQDAVEYFSAHPLGGGAAASTAPAASAPAPAATSPAPKAAGMASVFGGVQGFNTGGLKKVTDDMKAKNRKDEPALEVKEKPAAAPAIAAPKMAARGQKGPKGPPILELQRDTHWMVENQENEKMLVLEDVTMQQLVCIINCKNTTVHIKSKVKSIAVDGCEKVNVICGDVLSAVEFINCDRIAFQTTGKVNAVAIDKCNGLNLHLPKESLEAEITSSKSSEMNVNIPDPASSDPLDVIEIPIPEQFVTKIAGSKLNTEVSSLYTH